MTGRAYPNHHSGYVEARIVALHGVTGGHLIELECQGSRHWVSPPEYERSTDQALQDYQRAVLVAGDTVRVTPHPGSLPDAGQLESLMISRSSTTTPAMRLLLSEGTSPEEFEDMVEFMPYARAPLGRFCTHAELRQQISDAHAPSGRCNRVVLEKNIGRGTYLIGDAVHMSLRDRPLPETVLNGLIGHDLDDVLRHPLTEGAGIMIAGVRREGDDAILDLDVPSMPFAEVLSVLRGAEGKTS